jgi:hypothetical protein
MAEMAPTSLPAAVQDDQTPVQDDLTPLVVQGTRKPGRRSQQLAKVLDLDDEAMRGVPLPSLLARQAYLFANGGQAARDDPTGTFALSRPLSSVSHFISHSWRTSRLLKYCALCVHFNLGRAAICSAAANFIVFSLTLFAMDDLPRCLHVESAARTQ